MLSASIDAVDAGVLVDGERLVVGHAAKDGLRIVGARRERHRQLEDVLVEVRHLDVRMRVVEVDRVLQRTAGHRHARARREICLHVVAEVEAAARGTRHRPEAKVNPAASRSITVAPASVNACKRCFEGLGHAVPA